MTTYTLHTIPATGKLLLKAEGHTLATQIEHDLVPLISAGVSALRDTLIDQNGQYLVGTLGQLLGKHA